MRDAGGAIAQATGDAPRDVPGEFGSLSREPVERGRGHLQQQAVAYRTTQIIACFSHENIRTRNLFICTLLSCISNQ